VILNIQQSCKNTQKTTLSNIKLAKCPMGINPEAICKIRPQWKTLNERSFTRVTRRIRCLTILCHQKHIKMKESYKKYTPALADFTL